MEIPFCDADSMPLPEETLDAFDAMIAELFLKYTKKEIVERMWETENQAWPVNNPVEVLEWPQLAARNFWRNLDHPKLGDTLAYPGYLFLSNETENYVNRPAPLIGEHNDQIYGIEMGLSSTEIAELKKASVI
jgi:crotonobetainyl-CoA:carnitine CoA-transferase CaiB-like acyl-CoA transferase